MASKQNQILQYMKNGYTITPAIAATEFDVYHLASIILKIKKKGFEVLSETIEGTQSKRYWIENAK